MRFSARLSHPLVSSEPCGLTARPNVTPVWFRWDGASVKIWTTDTRAWSPPATGPESRLLGADVRRSLSAVVMRGPATIDERRRAGIRDEIRADHAPVRRTGRGRVLRLGLAGAAHDRDDRAEKVISWAEGAEPSGARTAGPGP